MGGMNSGVGGMMNPMNGFGFGNPMMPMMMNNQIMFQQMMASQMMNNQMNTLNNLMNNQNQGNQNDNNPQNNQNENKTSENIESQEVIVIFRSSGAGGNAPIMVQCNPDEKVKDIIERYRTKASDKDQFKKFIFNAKELNQSLTVSEAGISNNANIFVVGTKDVKGA